MTCYGHIYKVCGICIYITQNVIDISDEKGTNQSAPTIIKCI